MNLTIKNPNPEYDDDFYNWLIQKMQLFGIGAIDSRKLSTINNYINTTPKYKSIFKKSFNAKEIIIAFLYNLEVHKYWDRVIIESNINKIVPNSSAKIYNVVKLITFGTLNLKGYPVILYVFNYFEEHLDEFFEMYKRGL